jgi:hypothetical protein
VRQTVTRRRRHERKPERSPQGVAIRSRQLGNWNRRATLHPTTCEELGTRRSARGGNDLRRELRGTCVRREQRAEGTADRTTDGTLEPQMELRAHGIRLATLLSMRGAHIQQFFHRIARFFAFLLSNVLNSRCDPHVTLQTQPHHSVTCMHIQRQIRACRARIHALHYMAAQCGRKTSLHNVAARLHALSFVSSTHASETNDKLRQVSHSRDAYLPLDQQLLRRRAQNARA